MWTSSRSPPRTFSEASPQAELVRALRALGYRVDTPNERLPALVHGGGPRPGPVLVSVSDSSQFASALLLSSARGGWVVSARVRHAVSCVSSRHWP